MMRAALLFLALAVSLAKGACPICQFNAPVGTYTSKCVGDAHFVTCNSGQIGDGSTKKADRASCANGNWFGISCSGDAYDFGVFPNFDCPKLPDPEFPASCVCPFVDVGKSMNLPAPNSNCNNGVNHGLECDGNIFVQDVIFHAYSRMICREGSWFGVQDTNEFSLGPSSINVSCGMEAEPPFPFLLPMRGGLQYVSTVGAFQRYECGENLFVKLKIIPENNYVYAKFVECDPASISCRIVSTNGAMQIIGAIQEVSCRDYGAFDTQCSIPYGNNVWIVDGTFTCAKGGYPQTISYFDPADPNTLKQVTESTPDVRLFSASCGPDGWSISGTNIMGVQLAGFWCKGAPDHISTCASLAVTPDNVDYVPNHHAYECRYGEQLKVIKNSEELPGERLQCDSPPSEWTLVSSQYPTSVIPTGSKVSCVPSTPVYTLCPLNFYNDRSLVYAGMSGNVLTLFSCIDSVIEMDIEYFPELGMKGPVHAAFIAMNTTYYRISSSVDYDFFEAADFKKINSISCVDMGDYHAACTIPWDIGAIRKGNKYECMKGYYLNTVYYVDETGAAKTFTADSADAKSLVCNKDGWQIHGTALTGLRVTGIHCYDANKNSGQTPCASQNVSFEIYKLKKQFTCYDGEKMGYTLNGWRTLGAGRTLTCGTNVSGAREWQWSDFMGGPVDAIPAGAKMSCF